MTEYWDIYDEERTPLQRQHRRGEPLEDGEYHLLVHIWIYNTDGKVLLTQRHRDISFGSKWACTGGCVIAGEDSLTAALRETKEEIGLTIRPEEMMRVSQIRRLHSFVDTFVVCRDVDDSEITLQPDEVEDFCWVDRKEYKRMEQQKLLHPALRDFFREYLPTVRQMRRKKTA